MVASPLQHPQYDRIYKGYLSDKSWFGYGSSEDSPYLKYNVCTYVKGITSG